MRSFLAGFFIAHSLFSSKADIDLCRLDYDGPVDRAIHDDIQRLIFRNLMQDRR